MQLVLRKNISYIIAFLIFVALCFYLNKGGKFDFKVYYDAAQKVSSGESPYLNKNGGIEQGENAFPYKYSPIVAYLFVPFTLFDVNVSMFIFNIISMLVLCVCLLLCIRIFKSFHSKEDDIYGKPWLLLLSFLFILKPVLSNIELGQINPFLLLGILIIFSIDEEEGTAPFIIKSIIYALLVISKLTPALFLIIPVLKKDFKLLGCIFATMLVLLFIPSIMLGFNGNMEMLSQWMSNAFLPNLGLTPFWTNQSLLGMLERLFGDRRYDIYLTVLPAFYVTVIYAIISTLLCIMAVYKIYKINDKLFALSVLSVLYTIISPLSFPHYFVFLLIPFLYLFGKKAYRELFVVYLLINMSNYELLGPIYYELVHVYSIMLFGSFILFIKLMIEKEEIRI